MMLEGGYFTLGKLRGAPVRVHWSAPVGAFFFGQLRFVPGFWVAFVGLILAHEIGHALMVAAFGARVRGIDVTGLGGECRYDGNVSPMQRALIAWGGVLAQLAVLIVAGTLLVVFGSPESQFVAEVAQACTLYNLTLMAINLLPFRSLDGHEAWKIVPLLRARWKAPKFRVVPRAKVVDSARQTPLAPLGDVELELKRLRDILETAPRRR